MAAIEDWFHENQNVVVMTNLDDIGQPYSCDQWGDRYQDFNEDVFPLIIDDGTADEIWPWFHSGGYPSTVFIDHNMNVYFKMIGASFGPSKETIEAMIADCGDLCTLAPPAALFDFAVDGNTATFINLSDLASEGWVIESHAWDFGDGNTSSEESPIHTYDDDGTYEVSLTITTDIGTESEPYVAEIQIGSLNVSDINSPSEFGLIKNYPNPFNPNTTINYLLNESGYIKMNVYDISGKLVDQIIDGYQVSGQHSLIWNPVNLTSGMYYINLIQGLNADQMKVMYIK